jgi:2-oxoglutarate dehydrogenase E1 component
MAPIPDFIRRANASYIEAQYERYRSDPASVPDDWAAFFAGFDLAGGGATPGAVPGPVATPEGAIAPAAAAPGGREVNVARLVRRYRQHGHLAARLDPLGTEPEGSPFLDPAALGFAAADLAAPAGPSPFRGAAGETLDDLLAALRETYSGPVGVEYMELDDPERRAWLEERMEGTHNRPRLAPEDRRRLLEQLLVADGFEEFLHLRYPGQKRFSLEGAGTLIPMLDAMVESAAAAGVEQLVIGMPHRGRLNVLANLLHKPYESIFREFETNFLPEDIQGHGDVKYHLGDSCRHATRGGREIHLDLNFNPSHLEFVNPVVLGAMRARQDMMGDAARAGGFAVLLHGDAGFAGEGVVPETLAIAPLPHYETGGTLHLVINNQIGFTTSPGDARRSRYATDVARVEDAPIFHLNADDPEAALGVMALAVEYRMRFKRDVFVDLVCYRKHGHNELDDPTFTQPVMYRAIAAHPPVSKLYADRLAAEGVVTAAEAKAMRDRIQAGFQAAHQRARKEPAESHAAPLGGAWTGLDWAAEDWSAATAVPRDRLERVLRGLTAIPEGFHAHRKIVQLAAERERMFAEDRIDWGLGEALALGTLLVEGKHVRLSGQDTGRGTFSHRHSVLHDQEDGRRWIPLQHLGDDQGRFEVFDTPLAEAGPLGFEYGYSTADPHTLVVWEAQFGDFGNVAQVYIDQFIASAESKWRRMSGITLLLPHGYEGQGPEHSSGRLERFLELCANGNLQVCNLTTPAQFFHALRRQMLRRFRKPLVIMSPKSLLRHKLAVSAAKDLASGGFRTVIDDPEAGEPAGTQVIVLTSGKLYYTLRESRAASGAPGFALVRVEQLYPFPAEELRALFARYPGARDIRWVQEEPANMGAWRSTRHRIEAVLPHEATLRLVARKAAPSPATGYYPMHVEQERLLVERALASERPPAPGEGVEARADVPRRHSAAGARSGGRR